MTNENKIASMDAVGEDMGNLLLREGGFPHLPDPVFVPEKKVDAWNDAGTKPDHPCLCEVINAIRNGVTTSGRSFQYWNGEFWGFACGAKDQAIQNKDIKETFYLVIMWREVQP